MDDFLKAICCYMICLFIVTTCWVGLEHILEGAVHTSKADGYVAIILSGFISNTYMDITDKIRRNR